MGGQALYKLALLCVPSFSDLPGHGGQVLLFLVFWALNLLAVWRGIEGLKYVLAVKVGPGACMFPCWGPLMIERPTDADSMTIRLLTGIASVVLWLRG